MNFGRSIRAREAISGGRGPASLVAGWVGNGVSASWITGTVRPSEWHHTAANLGGGGRPTDYFARQDVLVAWLGANHVAARGGDTTARRRVSALVALAREWAAGSHEMSRADVRAMFAAAKATAARLPAPAPADPLVGRWVRLSREVSIRTRSRRGRYIWTRETVLGLVLRATPVMLTVLAADGWRMGEEQRIGRATVRGVEIVD